MIELCLLICFFVFLLDVRAYGTKYNSIFIDFLNKEGFSHTSAPVDGYKF